MKNKKVKSIKINIELQNGEKLIVTDPETMLLTYQNFDLADGLPKDKDAKDVVDMAGVFIMGNDVNVKLSLFVLLEKLSEMLSLRELIETFGKITQIAAEKSLVDEKLRNVKANKKEPN